MSAMLAAVLPLFALVVIGFLAGFRSRFREAARGLNAYVFTFGLPAFIFTSMVQAPPVDSFPVGVIGVVLISCATVAIGCYYLIRWLMRLRGMDHRGATVVAGPSSLAGSFGNVGYFGLPLSISLLGPEAGLTAGLVHMLHNILFMNGYPIIRTVIWTRSGHDDAAAGGTGSTAGHDDAAAGPGKPEQQGQTPVPAVIAAVLRRAILGNPLFAAIALALIIMGTGIELPVALVEPVSLIGASAVPVALFCVGLAMHAAIAGVRSKGVSLSAVSLAVVAKLLILPVLTWALVLAFGEHLDPIWAGTLIILAATPSSTTVFLFAQEYDADSRTAAAILVSTTVLSLITLPLIALLLL